MKSLILCLACMLSALAYGGTPVKGSGPAVKLKTGQQFLADVVRSAVAFPQSDPQDRLRVLAAAVSLIAPVSRGLAMHYTREGAQIEAGLLARGSQPAASVLGAAHVDCATAAEFMASVPDMQVAKAEQSLVSIITACPGHVLESAAYKLESARQQGVLAPRALLAAMEKLGVGSNWSQRQFAGIFASLGDTSPANVSDCAAILALILPVAERDTGREAGLRFLHWLGTMNRSAERNQAINTATSALREVLGDAGYQEALAADPVAGTVVATAGSGNIAAPQFQERDSILAAMNDREDRTQALAGLPPDQRARQAAALGFAAGSLGNHALAEQYFGMAFSAAEQVWAKRNRQPDVTRLLQEVTEAAAQVDITSAMKQAQALPEPSAQAIAMMAVARVVAGRED